MYLALSSLLFYFLARFFLLKLYIPDRYLIYSLNLFYCLGFALCGFVALRVSRWPQALIVLALILAGILGGSRLKGTGLTNYSINRPLYEALAQTPKDAVIAGHPNLMDNVPTFSQRKAFVTYKLAHPYSKGYWQQVRPRLDEVFAAYYAADPDEVLAFCRKYQISFLVVDDRHFSPTFLAGGKFKIPLDYFAPGAARVKYPFFAPFDEQIRYQIGDRREFALLSAQVFQPVTVNNHLKIFDMRPYLIPTANK